MRHPVYSSARSWDSIIIERAQLGLEPGTGWLHTRSTTTRPAPSSRKDKKMAPTLSELLPLPAATFPRCWNQRHPRHHTVGHDSLPQLPTTSLACSCTDYPSSLRIQISGQVCW